MCRQLDTVRIDALRLLCTQNRAHVSGPSHVPALFMSTFYDVQSKRRPSLMQIYIYIYSTSVRNEYSIKLLISPR